MTVEMLNAVVGDGGGKLERVKKKTPANCGTRTVTRRMQVNRKIAVLEPQCVMHKSTGKLWY